MESKFQVDMKFKEKRNRIIKRSIYIGQMFLNDINFDQCSVENDISYLHFAVSYNKDYDYQIKLYQAKPAKTGSWSDNKIGKVGHLKLNTRSDNDFGITEQRMMMPFVIKSDRLLDIQSKLPSNKDAALIEVVIEDTRNRNGNNAFLSSHKTFLSEFRLGKKGILKHDVGGTEGEVIELTQHFIDRLHERLDMNFYTFAELAGSIDIDDLIPANKPNVFKVDSIGANATILIEKSEDKLLQKDKWTFVTVYKLIEQ